MDEKDYYSAIATGYDELHGAEQDAKLAEFLERAGLPDGLTLLDVGCGTGRSASMLAPLHTQWYGIDPSPGLIVQAPIALHGRIKQEKAERISWPDATFDAVLSLTAMQNFDDPGAAIDEMRRVAKPGAIIMISFLKKSPKREALDGVIRARLDVKASWEQEKDMMYLCTRKRHLP